MENFHVSVIIPVYNAAKFVRKAVESVIILEEVGEVILVEDGSPDDAFEICKELKEKYPKVKLYQHTNGENKGAGASRNLGIRKASFDFIAFLDADDWYLSNRFKKDVEVFSLYPDADGVYGATGFYYEENGFLEIDNLTTFQKEISPNSLIFSLLDGHGGRFTTDAITLKKRFIEKAGYFDEDLRLHQDTHLWLRYSLLGNLYAGEIGNAIAIRRVHSGNRIVTQCAGSSKLLHEKLFYSFYQLKKIDNKVFRIIFKRYIGTKTKKIFLRYPLAIWAIL